METIRREPGKALSLGSFDVVVCGGGLSGWAAAVTLARLGHEVLLAAEHTALGWEIWGALSVWLESDADPPDMLNELLDGLSPVNAVATGVFDPVATEVYLDRVASEAGVKLLLQVCCQAGDPGQVLVNGKWGLMAAQTRVIVDATPTGTVAASAGAKIVARETNELPLRRALMVRADLDDDAQFAVPAEFPVSDSTVTARRGRWEGDVIIEAALTLPTSDPSRFEMDSRRALTEIGAYLRTEVPAFAACSFVQVGHDAVLPRDAVCIGTPGEPLVPEAVEGLVLASPVADIGDLSAVACQRPGAAIAVGLSAGEQTVKILEG